MRFSNKLTCADGEGAPAPFESQYFHDDADDGGDYGFPDSQLDTAAPVDGEDEDLWQGTQGQELKRSRPENVNFAKKAKRVDVKRLKDDIWSGLKVLVPPRTEDSGDDTVS
jgi:condensin complex subunit 2